MINIIYGDFIMDLDKIDKENYCFSKNFEKEALENIEKIGEYLVLIDAIVDELRFFALINKEDWILDLFHNFKVDNNYDMYRDTIINRLGKGDNIIKKKKEWILKVKKYEKKNSKK